MPQIKTVQASVMKYQTFWQQMSKITLLYFEMVPENGKLLDCSVESF